MKVIQFPACHTRAPDRDDRAHPPAGGEVAPGEPAPPDESARRQSLDVVDKVVRRRTRRRRTPAGVIASALDRPRPRFHADPARVLAGIAEAVEPDGGIGGRAHVGEEPASAAFWRIWLAHRDYLHRFSLRFSSGNPADAEDAMSEAMLKAAQAFARSDIRNHRAWLLRLVHNACMDRHRNAQRQSRLASDMRGDAGEAVPVFAPRLDRSPEDLLAASQLTHGLQEALAALPRSLAGPLLLYLDGLSDAEIAASLNVSREVVRKRRQMARDLLRRQLLL